MEDTIYLEADSEITEAIDKLKKAKGHTVKLVVPARSPLAQSVVNLKLLKKAAKDNSKELALVTGDKTARHLAGRLEIPVAATVKAEPKVPEVAKEDEKPDIDQAAEEAEAAKADEETAAEEPDDREDDSPVKTRDLDETEDDRDEAKPVKAPKKSKADKKNKIPNYNDFQKKLFIGIGAAVGVIAVILLITFVASANIIITAQATQKPVNINFTANATATTDPITSIAAARLLTESKDFSANVTATGQKDIGSKATGNLSIKNCEDSNPRSLPAGASFSTNGKNFTTNSAVTVAGGSFSGGGSVCNSAPAQVGITATDNGDSYNFSNASFSTPSLTANFKSTGTTSGGSSKVVTVLSQSDIDKAKQSALDANNDKMKSDLQNKASKDLTVLPDTYSQNVTSFSASSAADSQVSSASISGHVDYTMLAVPNSALDQLINAALKKDLKATDDIYENGRDSADIRVTKTVSKSEAELSLKTTAYVGAKIDKEALSKAIAGKSKHDASTYIKDQVPSAQSVNIHGVPFWPWLPAIPSHNKIQIKVITN